MKKLSGYCGRVVRVYSGTSKPRFFINALIGAVVLELSIKTYTGPGGGGGGGVAAAEDAVAVGVVSVGEGEESDGLASAIATALEAVVVGFSTDGGTDGAGRRPRAIE